VKYKVIQQQLAHCWHCEHWALAVVFTYGRCTKWWCWNVAMSEAWQLWQSGGSKAYCSR